MTTAAAPTAHGPDPGSATAPAPGPADAPAPPAPRRRQPPLDPRLVREVRAARRHVARTVVLGLVQAGCVIVTAVVIARLGSALLVDGVMPLATPELLLALVAALAVRAGTVLLEQATAHRAATAAISDLRARIVGHAARLGPRAGAGRGADLTALATTGIENMRQIGRAHV